MFSVQEENYIKGLIASYYKHGYKYYLCHTVTESNNTYDFYIYFSKEEISAITSDTFELKNAVFMKVDSSQRNDNGYNGSTHSRDVIQDSFSEIVNVHQAEFIYTNAVVNYKTDSIALNPDINYIDCPILNNYCIYGILIVLVISFLFSFVSSILRLRK